MVLVVAVVLSLQPHQPGDSQVVLEVVVAELEVVVTGVVVVSSLHPNQPGVLHVEVELLVVDVVVTPVVVDSSRQPHLLIVG